MLFGFAIFFFKEDRKSQRGWIWEKKNQGQEWGWIQTAQHKTLQRHLPRFSHLLTVGARGEILRVVIPFMMLSHMTKYQVWRQLCPDPNKTNASHTPLPQAVRLCLPLHHLGKMFDTHKVRYFQVLRWFQVEKVGRSTRTPIMHEKEAWKSKLNPQKPRQKATETCTCKPTTTK